MVESAPCHVAVVRLVEGQTSFKKIMVPVDGSLVSRVAAEFAARYAELAGAELTLAILTEHRPQVEALTGEGEADEEAPPPPASTDEELERISRVFRTVARKPKLVRVDYDPSSSALAAAVASGTYDLVVIGAENRAVQNRLFFGYENERIIRASTASVAVVVPHFGKAVAQGAGSSLSGPLRPMVS